VAERLSGFCEAILDISGICKSELRCCVAKQIFKGDYPPELIIPSRNSAGQQNTIAKVEVTTTSSPRSPPTPTPRSQESRPARPSGSCPGTCVTGFFALLCDEIDRHAQCQGNGRCCITKKVNPSERPQKTPSRPPPPSRTTCPGFCLPQTMSSLCTSPSNILHNTDSCNKGTVCCESRTGGTPSLDRTPPPPKLTTPRPQLPPPRPQRPAGPDMTQILLGLAPQILSAATGNSDAGTTAAALLPVLGSLLGGGSSGPNRNPSQGGGGGAGGLVASLLGSFLGGGGGNSQQRVPPRQGSANPFSRPSLPTVTTTTTTTTTTTEAPDARSECPGTCIASYLSFTCFGKFLNVRAISY
jgi:hypothetical protein